MTITLYTSSILINYCLSCHPAFTYVFSPCVPWFYRQFVFSVWALQPFLVFRFPVLFRLLLLFCFFWFLKPCWPRTWFEKWVWLIIRKFLYIYLLLISHWSGIVQLRGWTRLKCYTNGCQSTEFEFPMASRWFAEETGWHHHNCPNQWVTCQSVYHVCL